MKLLTVRFLALISRIFLMYDYVLDPDVLCGFHVTNQSYNQLDVLCLPLNSYLLLSLGGIRSPLFVFSDFLWVFCQ